MLTYAPSKHHVCVRNPRLLCQVLELTQGQRVEVEILAVVVQQIQDSRCQHGMDGTHTPGIYAHAFATYMISYMVYDVCAHAVAIYMVTHGMWYLCSCRCYLYGSRWYGICAHAFAACIWHKHVCGHMTHT